MPFSELYDRGDDPVSIGPVTVGLGGVAYFKSARFSFRVLGSVLSFTWRHSLPRLSPSVSASKPPGERRRDGLGHVSSVGVLLVGGCVCHLVAEPALTSH